ncbi:hypothetical protein SmJEL517_g03033 [Synchytrium microbalum]|uniref:Uncharacterized protein n=1 Tax=Synchytrium microbalum TaxID=1806994 RepID=A0A507C3Q0_9FUNG|nr:uncharacterized protein SmJEL517_g03033 [Synchytrium microbalum]TPX34302.1 hypothetical protein SmJEL517_g03033 [Synchytrium microbalum]
MSSTNPPPSQAPNQTAPNQPLVMRLKSLVLTAQFLWFAGHLTTVVQALSYLVVYRLSAEGARSYSRAYMGTLLSYGIILYKAHGIPQISRAYMQRILLDENTQYLLLALIWLTSSPISVTLIPYTTFSVFHSITFIRTDVLPAIVPPTSAQVSLSRRLQQSLLQFVQRYQASALRMVAYAEVYVTLPVLVLSVFTGRASILSPFLYANFLRFRYIFSPTTKQAFNDLRIRLDGMIEQNASTPTWAKAMYVKARDYLIQYASVDVGAGGAAGGGAAR